METELLLKTDSFERHCILKEKLKSQNISFREKIRGYESILDLAMKILFLGRASFGTRAERQSFYYIYVSPQELEPARKLL
ncbi:MAG: hypothetical protein QM793_13985 [Muricomes sp.]